MLRNVIVGLTASLLIGVAFIPDDALAYRGGGARAGAGVRGGAVGVAGRGVAYRGVGAYGGRYAAGYHPVARGAAVAVGTAAVAGTGLGWGGGYYGGGWGSPAVGVGAQPWDYDVYGPGGYYGRPVARAAAVAAGTAPVAATGWGWNQPYGGGYGWGGGWGTGYGAYAASQPYDSSVYGQGGPYGVTPGTCYVDCDNYRKALIESGFNPKDYYTKAGDHERQKLLGVRSLL